MVVCLMLWSVGHRTQLHTELSGLQSQMSDLEAQLSSFAANPAAAALPAALDLGNKIYLVGGATIDNGQDHVSQWWWW